MGNFSECGVMYVAKWIKIYVMAILKSCYLYVNYNSLTYHALGTPEPKSLYDYNREMQWMETSQQQSPETFLKYEDNFMKWLNAAITCLMNMSSYISFQIDAKNSIATWCIKEKYIILGGACTWCRSWQMLWISPLE